MVAGRAPRYVPDRGDVVWLRLDPQAGRERAGHRPALVLSPAAYNRAVGLALTCPVASRVKGYPFEVALPAGLRVSGVVLADHVKSLDWLARQASRAEQVPPGVVSDVLGKLRTLL